ncbi:hypothetical protein Tco_0535915 [Tanacetum coccineum]
MDLYEVSQAQVLKRITYAQHEHKAKVKETPQNAKLFPPFDKTPIKKISTVVAYGFYVGPCVSRVSNGKSTSSLLSMTTLYYMVKCAHMGNEPYFRYSQYQKFLLIHPSSSDVISYIVPSRSPRFLNTTAKGAKDHPFENIIGALRPDPVFHIGLHPSMNSILNLQL